MHIGKSESKSKQKQAPLYLCSLLAISLAAADHKAPSRGNASSSKDALQRKIVAFTEDTSCATSSDCGVVAYGALACGGPSQYVVFSKKKTNEQKLNKLAKLYTRLEEKENRTKGGVGICMALQVPHARCNKNYKCVADSEE